MIQHELTIEHKGTFLARLFVSHGAICFSEDTDECLRRAIRTLVYSEGTAIYKDDRGRLISAPLDGDAEVVLAILKDYFRFRFGYHTQLRQRFSAVDFTSRRQPLRSVFFNLLASSPSKWNSVRASALHATSTLSTENNGLSCEIARAA